MNPEQIELLSAFFNDFSIERGRIVSKQIEISKNIIDAFQTYSSRRLDDTIKFNRQIVDSYLSIREELNKLNKKESILFNGLSFFSRGETLDSILIAKFLDPKSEHGQGSLFLKSFLQLLEIEVMDDDNWIVTAEKGRIDVLIKTQDHSKVIIIENKSNYAIDQQNQLYRYWYQEIYLPNFKRFGDKTVELTANNKNYRILYLTPANWKLPSENTRLKPKTDGYADFLPDEIPIEPDIWLFNMHIVNWLRNSIGQMNRDNHRLREYTKQYIELWTQ